MPKKVGKQQSNILSWIVLLIWLFAALIAGVMLVAGLAGFVVPPNLAPDVVPQVPTVPALPTAAAVQQPENQPTADSPVPDPPATPFLPAQGTGGGAQGVFVEPTFTPLVPVTPTPTFFLTPPPAWDGPIVIGTSTGGRPIEVYRFGNGPIKRLIIAGIHGGYEWNTIALADELIAYLQDNPDFVPHTVTLYILRAMNPDGYARSRGVRGRANDNNVDLNRNFPVNWQADWPRAGCWSYLPITGGSGPGSEQETQVVMDFILQTRPTAIISYHSAALGIFPGGEPWEADSIRLAETLAAASTYAFPPVDTGCFFTGSLPDFAVANGIAAVDLELHTHEFTDFEENLGVLKAFLEWRR